MFQCPHSGLQCGQGALLELGARTTVFIRSGHLTERANVAHTAIKLRPNSPRRCHEEPLQDLECLQSSETGTQTLSHQASQRLPLGLTQLLELWLQAMF